MRYYLIEQDKKDIQIPVLKDWFKRITDGNKKSPNIDSLGDRVLFTVDAKSGATYPEMIFYPFLLVTKEIRKCLSLYEPNMEFQEVFLLDQKSKESHQYFRPDIPKVACLSEESLCSSGHVELTKIVLDQHKIPNKVLFRIDGPEKNYYIIRLDALESFLRRGLNAVIVNEVVVAK